MLAGNSAIEYLTKYISYPDPSESSHWKYFSRNIKLKKNKFEGFEGFGKIGRRLFGFSNVLHFFLQKPFRNEGKKLKEFNIIDKIARKLAQKQKRSYDSDCFRHTLILSFIKERLDKNLKNNPTVCIIGDGFAFMSSLLININFTKKIYLINITKVLIADLLYLKIWMGDQLFNSSVNLVTNEEDLKLFESKTNDNKKLQIIAIQAKDFELLKFCDFDFVINIHSMQEMNNDIVNKYFYYIKNSVNKNKILFYCCNRVEKKLFDGTISRFNDYPWNEDDEVIFDQICPIWNQKTYSFKPPFYKDLDGKIKHKLVFLSKQINKIN